MGQSAGSYPPGQIFAKKTISSLRAFIISGQASPKQKKRTENVSASRKRTFSTMFSRSIVVSGVLTLNVDEITYFRQWSVCI
jgi:hypothetical protein